MARTGRFSEAARLLNMSVSSVSQQMASLEGDFGTALFVRSNRGVALSPAGEALRGHAEAIEAQWRQAFRAVRGAIAGEPSLHVAASQTVAEVFLPEPLGQFCEAHPQVRLKLAMANSAAVLGQVETGQVDFGIVEGRVAGRGLRSTALWHDRLGLIVSRRHPWAGRDRIPVSDLLGVGLILREEGSGTRTILEAGLQQAGYDIGQFHTVMELSSLRAIAAMVSHNVAVSVVSDMVMRDRAGTPDIVFVPIEGLRLERQINLVRRQADDLDANGQALVALLRRHSAAAGPS